MTTPLENILNWAESKKQEYKTMSNFSNDPMFYLGRIDVLLDLVKEVYKNIEDEKNILKKAYEDGEKGLGNSEQYYQSLFNQDS